MKNIILVVAIVFSSMTLACESNDSKASDTNDRGDNELHTAVLTGDIETVRAFIRGSSALALCARNNHGKTPYDYAAINGSSDMVWVRMRNAFNQAGAGWECDSINPR